MKRFIALFVVLGAVLLAAPGVIGYQVEPHYQGLMQQFAKGGVNLVSQEYQRNWFGAESRADFVITLPAGPEGGEPEQLTFSLVSHITHGPLTSSGLHLADIQSDIRVDGEALLPADYDAAITTLVGIMGDGVTRIDLPASDIPASGERPTIHFGGIQGEMRFNAEFTQVEANMAMPTLRMEQADGQFLEISDVTVDTGSQLDASGLMLGGGRLSISHIGLRGQQDDTRLEIRQLDIDAQSEMTGSGVAASASYQLEQMEVNGTRYGPARIQLGVGNLSSPALLEIQQAMDEINTQQLSEQEKGRAVLSVLMGNAPALLKGDPLLTIDHLSIQTPDGQISGNLSLQSVGLELKEIGNGPALLNKLVAEASLQMPRPLLELLLSKKLEADLLRQFEQRRLIDPDSKVPGPEQISEMADSLGSRQLTQMLGQEIVVAQDGMISTRATLSGGLLNVNGKTIPLPQAPQ